LVIQAVEMVSDQVIVPELKESIVSKFKKKLADHRAFIIKNGVDPDEIENWTWKA
jgi:phosphoketolase